MKLTFLIFFLLALVSGCGTETGSGLVEADPTNEVPEGGTTPGVVDGAITLSSGDFSTNLSNTLFLQANSVNSFKLCVTQIRLIRDNDQWIYKSGTKDITISAGLIDLSTGNAKTWGVFTIPTALPIERIRILAKKDTALCGVNYSAEFNGTTTDKNVELHFKFNPSVLINSGDSLRLSLSALIIRLQQTSSSGGFNGDVLRNTLESYEDSATKN